MIEASGGTAPAGAQHERASLDDADAEQVSAWLKRLVAQRRREGHEPTETARAE